MPPLGGTLTLFLCFSLPWFSLVRNSEVQTNARPGATSYRLSRVQQYSAGRIRRRFSWQDLTFWSFVYLVQICPPLTALLLLVRFPHRTVNNELLDYGNAGRNHDQPELAGDHGLQLTLHWRVFGDY
jgi:hypothetical protein